MSATADIRITKAHRDLAKELGVQAGVVAQLSAEHGIEHVREKLGLGEEPEKPAPIVVETVAPAFVNLKVLRRCPNPIWIICQSPPPCPVAVNVRVRRNNRLRPGMVLQCSGSGREWKCVHAGFAPV